MKGITRRKVLQSLGIGIGTAALGVGCNETKAPDGLVADLGMLPPPDSALPVDAAAGHDAAAAPRDSAAPPDAGPPEDLAGPPPDARTLLAPIDTIVVLMMENRSYDHYLGSLRLVEGRNFDGLRGMEWNPDPSGNKVYVKPLATLTPADPPHSWAAAHQQWNHGANDGFVAAHAGADQNDVMGYYVRDQLPITYALADNAAVCERWFSSVMGPTWPNRMFLHAATSNGVTTNTGAPGLKSIFDALQTAGISNKNYYSDVAWAAGGYLKLNNLDPIETYFQNAAAGTLPKFSIIDPIFLGAGANDDHPSHDVALGQALIASVFRALAASPQWNRSLFVLLYDENGGFYDHVKPPTCVDDRAEFRQLGFRIPALVAGPYVKRGAAIDTVFEHVSVAATAATRWELPPLNARAAATNDLSSCIDPQLLASPQPPPVLPMVTVRRSVIARRPDYAGEHPELVDALERGLIPRHLDRRREGRAVSDRILAEGARLGAVRIID